MLGAQNEKGDGDDYEKIKDQRAFEMELRREAMIKRTDKKQLLRRFHIDRREAFKREALSQAQEVADRKTRQVRQTYRLAEELSRRKKADVQESLKPREIKSSVESKVKDPSNETLSQLVEEKIRREENSAKLIKQWYQNDNFAKKQREEAEGKKRNYRKDLQNQLIDNRLRLREEEEEKHRERKILEDLGEVLYKEELQIEKQKRETAAKLQVEERAFLQAREIWKDEGREALKKEHETNSRIIAAKEAEEKRRAAQKVDTQTFKDAMIQKLSEKLNEDDRAKREREEVCYSFYQAEKDSERARESTKQLMKKKQTRTEMLTDMMRQYQAAAEKRAKEVAIDEAFARYLAEERTNNEERLKRNEKERHERKIQYGKELRETIMGNRIRHAVEILRKQSEVNCHGKSVEEAAVKNDDARDNAIAWNINEPPRREGNVHSEKRKAC